jgi:hypothetical protein
VGGGWVCPPLAKTSTCEFESFNPSLISFNDACWRHSRRRHRYG